MVSYDPARRYEFTVEDIIYRQEGDLALPALLYRPQGEGPFPALVDVHGGAWNNGVRSDNPALAEGLAASGVVVLAIDFRMGGAHPFPSSVQDINYAIRWLKGRAPAFNADPATVGGLGVSSGGHLILLSAMRPAHADYSALPFTEGPSLDARVAYAISCWGVLDPYGRYELAQSKGNKDLMGNHERYFLTVETQQEANPLRILQRGEAVELPPALLIQGTADEALPKGMVEQVAELYAKAGGQVELALFEGMPHGIAGWTASEVARMVERIKGFIAQQGDHGRRGRLGGLAIVD